MAQPCDLKELLDILTSKPNFSVSFIDGKLETSEVVQPDLSVVGWVVVEHPVLRQISLTLQSNIDGLVKAASFKNSKSYKSIEVDLENAICHFQYFSRWTKKLVDLKVRKNLTFPGRFTGLILEDCPIFLTLTWLIAALLAPGNALNIYVKEKYLVPSVCFAFLLNTAGLPKGVVNVLPYRENVFQNACESQAELHLGGIIPEKFVFGTNITRSNFLSVLVKNYSLSPMLILKSADISSAIDCFIKSTSDHEAVWFPNSIYVEEAVYKLFSCTLKYAIKILHDENETDDGRSWETESVRALIADKKSEGYEMTTLLHRFSACTIIFKHKNSDLPDNFLNTKGTRHHLVSVMPIRTAEEGVQLLNATSNWCSSLWSGDAVEISSIPYKLKCGTVWVNCASYFHASVPLSLWHSQSFGTFSGKRAVYETLKYDGERHEERRESLYASKRNSMLPVRSINSVLKLSMTALDSWSKMILDERLEVLLKIATSMKNNWNSHFKLVLNNTPESVWNACISYITFWASFMGESLFEQNLTAHNCHVQCTSEPLGIIGIMVGSTDLDKLVFLVAAALAHGNTIIIGISYDTMTPIIGNEFERLFEPGLVRVFMDDSASLLRQFQTSKFISSIWWVTDSLPLDVFLTAETIRKVVRFHSVDDMTNWAEIIESVATKTKCVWLPFK